jgi:hypothetical protein
MGLGLSLLPSGCSCPERLTEAELLAKLDAARIQLHEVVILRMKTWLPEETLKGLRQAEAFRREQVRRHFRLLERFRTQPRAVGTFSL